PCRSCNRSEVCAVSADGHFYFLHHTVCFTVLSWHVLHFSDVIFPIEFNSNPMWSLCSFTSPNGVPVSLRVAVNDRLWIIAFMKVFCCCGLKRHFCCKPCCCTHHKDEHA